MIPVELHFSLIVDQLGVKHVTSPHALLNGDTIDAAAWLLWPKAGGQHHRWQSSARSALRTYRNCRYEIDCIPCLILFPIPLEDY